MVNLPQKPGLTAMSSLPRSSVSGQDVANPFLQVAQAVGSVADFIDRKETDDARISGENAVSRDENGNLKVDLRPNWSAKDRVYNASASQAYAAAKSSDIRNDLARIQIDAQGNPDTFKNAAMAYRNQSLLGTPDALRGPMTQILDSEIARNQTSVISQKFETDTAAHKAAIVNERDYLMKETEALAFQGGTDTDAYRGNIAKIHTLNQELVGNPFFRYSQREADFDMKLLERSALTQSISGQADRLLKSGDIAGAQALADRLATDETTGLGPVERRELAGFVNQAIKGHRAQLAADLKPLQDQAKEFRESFKVGGDLDNNQVAVLSQKMAAMGDAAGAIRLMQDQATFREQRATNSLPVNQRLGRAISGLSGGSVADKIIGVESSGNATATNPNSSATGAGQFLSSTWMTMVKTYRPDLIQGRTTQEVLALRNDPELSREMVGRYAQENENFLKNQGINPTPGDVYLAHFLGPRGAAQVLKSDPGAAVASIVGDDVVKANPFLQGMSAADLRNWAQGKMGGAVTSQAGIDPQRVKFYQDTVTDGLRDLKPDIEAGLKQGIMPDPDTMSLIGRGISVINDPGLRDDYVKMFEASDAYRAAFRADPVQAEATLSALKGAAAQDGASIAEQAIIGGTEAGMKAREEGFRKDPLGTASQVYADFPPLPAFDASRPDTWGQTFQQLQRSVDYLRARDDVGNISALPAAVLTKVQRVMASGTSQDKASVLGSLSQNLDPETYRATLGALVGSGVDTATAAAGALMSVSPQVGESVLRGAEALKANPSLAPKKEDANRSEIDELLPPHAFAPGYEAQRQMILSAATARYADLSQQIGDTSGMLDSKRMEQAIGEVTGGMLDMNGGKVVAPAYGMKQDDFDKMLASLSDQDLAGAMTSNGQRVTASDLRREGRLRAVADGRYLLEFGNADYPTYVLRQPSPGTYNQSAFVLDLRDR